MPSIIVSEYAVLVARLHDASLIILDGDAAVISARAKEVLPVNTFGPTEEGSKEGLFSLVVGKPIIRYSHVTVGCVSIQLRWGCLDGIK